MQLCNRQTGSRDLATVQLSIRTAKVHDQRDLMVAVPESQEQPLSRDSHKQWSLQFIENGVMNKNLPTNDRILFPREDRGGWPELLKLTGRRQMQK